MLAQELKLNTTVDNKFNVTVSAGNKTIGLISYISVILVGLVLILIPPLSWQAVLAGVLLILVYSLLTSKITYVTISNKALWFESVFFKSRIEKDIILYEKVVQVIPFFALMEIHLKDKTKFFCWGSSAEKIDTLIKEKMKSL